MSYSKTFMSILTRIIGAPIFYKGIGFLNVIRHN